MLPITKHYAPNSIEETEDSGRQTRSYTQNCNPGGPTSKISPQLTLMC